jgi:hypothetical protein
MNMRRKIFLTILSFAMGVCSLQAQFRAGVKAGPNLSSLSMVINGVETDIYKPRIGYSVGFTGEYMPSRRFGMQAELVYGYTGATIRPDKYVKGVTNPGEGVTYNGYIGMHTVQLPLMAKVKFDLSRKTKIYFLAGGFGMYALESNQRMTLSTIDESLKLKWSLHDPHIRILGGDEDNVAMQRRFHAGIALDVGMEIGRMITVGAGFRRVLNNMAAFEYQSYGATMKPSIKMWTASVSVGYYL